MSVVPALVSYVIAFQTWFKKKSERRQAFSIFATRMLEQRILRAYQEFESRRDKLRVFRRIQDNRRHRQSIQVFPATTIVFKSGEIEIDYTIPINTSGAFCDLVCGKHADLGKVALKRLRSDMSGSSRLSVGPLPYLCE